MNPQSNNTSTKHIIFFLMFEALGIYYERNWWNTMLCTSTPNSWKTTGKECIDGKNIVPSKSLISAVSYKQ